MMWEIKQPYLKKYLWLAGIVYSINILWSVMENTMQSNQMYSYSLYRLPQIYPFMFRAMLFVFFIFQISDALRFMHKGSHQRMLILPIHRFIFPISQLVFTLLLLLFLWCVMSSSILLSYGIYTMFFGVYRDGLIYALLNTQLTRFLLPLPLDQLICLFFIMISVSVWINAICLFLQAPSVICIQYSFFIVWIVFMMNIKDAIQGATMLSPYVLGVIAMGIMNGVSIAYTLYRYQNGRACD